MGGGVTDDILVGDEAHEALAESARRTTARRDLAANPRFDQLSPEVGVLDDDVLAAMIDDDFDETVSLLADMAGATDERLRARALEAAAGVIVDMVRSEVTGRGIGALRSRPATTTEGEVDIDASIDRIVDARSQQRPLDLDDLDVRVWERRDTAVCLVVDRSGSMGGERVATAAVAAAAVALRHPHASSVVAFSDRALVIRPMTDDSSATETATALLRLRGHGPTDVGLALRAAAEQCRRSNAARRVIVLLSDCRWTSGDDPTEAARSLDAELVIVAPHDDQIDASRLAADAGATLVALAGPSDAARAMTAALAG